MWDNRGSQSLPRSGNEYYRAYVDITYLRPYYVIPIFLLVFVLALYLLGKLLSAGMGRAFWTAFEHLINRLPLIRTVYSAVKQFSDFFFSDSDVQFDAASSPSSTRGAACGAWRLSSARDSFEVRGQANNRSSRSSAHLADAHGRLHRLAAEAQ